MAKYRCSNCSFEQEIFLPAIFEVKNLTCPYCGIKTMYSLPEKPAPRRATWKELAYWLIDGKGLVLDENRGKIDTGVIFSKEDLDAEVSDYLKVMRRDDADWHEPDVEYMGITEVKTYEDVVKREG